MNFNETIFLVCLWVLTAISWFGIGWTYGRRQKKSQKENHPFVSVKGNRNNSKGTLTFEQLKELINNIRTPMLEDERFACYPRLSKVEGKETQDAWRLDFVDKIKVLPSQTIDIDADNPCWEMFFMALVSVNCYKR
jgi:hypothetical protein